MKLKQLTQKKIIYRFAYKGVPENLFIKHIEIRDKPKLLKPTLPEELDVTGAESETDKLIGYSDIPEKEIETELDEILEGPNCFGESFEDIAY